MPSTYIPHTNPNTNKHNPNNKNTLETVLKDLAKDCKKRLFIGSLILESNSLTALDRLSARLCVWRKCAEQAYTRSVIICAKIDFRGNRCRV